MPCIQPDQRSRDWFDAHLGRITASIAAGCLGWDTHCSRQKAWRTILGTQKPYGNRYTDWGHRHEQTARERYEIETGDLVTETGFWVHPVYDWLGASPDGLVGSEGLLECKCLGMLPNKITLPHRVQMQIQLAVTERQWCDYIVLANNETRCWRVHRAGIAGLIRRLAAFRAEYVLTETEPPRKTPRRKR